MYKQQWGSNLNSLTLPIAFSTECFNFQCWQYDITEYRYSGIVPSIACSNTAISGWNGQYSLRYLVIDEQQWGAFATKANVNPKTTQLPIACTLVLIGIAPPVIQTAEAGHNVFDSATETSITFEGSHTYGGTLYWIAICKQQWGYLSFSAVVTAQKVITYPIALSEIALPVAIAIAESYGNDAGLAINNDCMGNHYSSCEFNVISYGTQRCVGIIFVVIGKQQWGVLITSANAITFPVTFTNIEYMFLSKIYGPASGGSDLVAYNYFQRLLTGVTYDYSYTRNWIAIGQ